MGLRLLCLLGFHRWAWFGTEEPDAPQARRCRRCQRQEVYLVPLGRWTEAMMYYLPDPAGATASREREDQRVEWTRR